MNCRWVTILNPPNDRMVLLVTENTQKWNMKKKKQTNSNTENRMATATMEINSHLLETGSAALFLLLHVAGLHRPRPQEL